MKRGAVLCTTLVLTVFSMAAGCLVLLASMWFPVPVFAQERTDAAVVTTAAELKVALAEGVATILLEGGQYGNLQVSKNRPKTAPLLLKSAHPETPALFREVQIYGASNVIFEDVVFDYQFVPGHRSNHTFIHIADSTGVVLRRSLFDGDIARGMNSAEDGFATGTALRVQDSSDVTVEHSVFRRFQRGLIIHQSQDITVRNNDIHAMRMDGMNFAEVQRVVIQDNHLHDFKGRPGREDHRDMIQFWTNRTGGPSVDVVIRDNLLNVGNGAWTQSIFMRNEEVDTGRAGPEMYYRNILIEGNVIINAHLHGITVGEVDGLRIRNNTVVRNAQAGGDATNQDLWTPSIRLKPEARNVVIERNVVSRIVGAGRQSNWEMSENLIVQDRNSRLAFHYDEVFGPAARTNPTQLASFRPRPGGPLDGAGVGAPRLWAPVPEVPGPDGS